MAKPRCCRGICHRIRNAFCTSNVNKAIPKTLCGRIFWDGTPENAALKGAAGFAAGVLVAVAALHVAMYGAGLAPIVALPTVAVLGFGLSIALASSSVARCIAMLAVPSLFTGRGRDLVMTYIMVLVLSGPVKNFAANVLVAADTLNCAEEAVDDAASRAAAPFRDAHRRAKAIVAAVKDFASDVREKFDPIVDAYRKASDRLDRLSAWIDEKTRLCKLENGNLQARCSKKFERVFDKAAESLTSMVGTVNYDEKYQSTCITITYFFSIRGHICRNAGDKVCVKMNEGWDKICSIDDRLAARLRSATSGARRRIDQVQNKVHEMLYFDADIDSDFSYKLNKSRTEAEVREAIRNAILRETSWIHGFLYYVGSLFTWFGILILVASAIYRKKYLSKDEFDNVYITTLFRSIDETRRKLGRDVVLPLRRRERNHYILLSSLRMSKRERKNLFVGILALVLQAGHVSIYLAVDYGLWWTLARIRHYQEMIRGVEVKSAVQVDVGGKGLMAKMYGRVANEFDPTTTSEADEGEGNADAESSSGCLPRPSAPDTELYEFIGMLLLLLLWLHLGEAYALRLRPVICSWFYPERARERAVHLYNQVLMQRGNFFAAVVQDAVTAGKQPARKIGALAILIARVGCLKRLAKLFGYARKYCAACGFQGLPSDMERFVHCGTYGCKGVYCNECRVDLKNVCVLCSSAIKREEQSSEEVDSSDADQSDGGAQSSDDSQTDDEMKELLLAIQEHQVARAHTHSELAAAERRAGTLNRNKSACPHSPRTTRKDLVTVDIFDTTPDGGNAAVCSLEDRDGRSETAAGRTSPAVTCAAGPTRPETAVVQAGCCPLSS